MNIVEILKYCPEGTKLYTPIYGNVVLDRVLLENGKFPILIKDATGCGHLFTENGCHRYNLPNVECVLFPSKEQRNWNEFRLPVKRGDIMMGINGECPFIATGELSNTNSPKYICGINSLGEFQLPPFKGGWTPNFYIPASEEAKKELFDKMEEAGYKWNTDTLELEKIVPKFKEGDIIINKEGSIFLISKIFDNGNTLEMAAVLNKGELTINPNVWQSPYGKSIASEEDRNRLFSALAKKGYIYDKEQFIKQEFKSFDKVLVKSDLNEEWSLDLFSHYDEKNKDYPYVCLTSRYRYCIPYEGNEYLVGKTAN